MELLEVFLFYKSNPISDIANRKEGRKGGRAENTFYKNNQGY